MIVSEIELFSLPKTKLGEQEAKALVEFVEQKADKKFEDSKKELATKADIADIRVEMHQMKVEIIKWLVSVAIALGGLIITAAKFIK